MCHRGSTVKKPLRVKKTNWHKWLALLFFIGLMALLDCAWHLGNFGFSFFEPIKPVFEEPTCLPNNLPDVEQLKVDRVTIAGEMVRHRIAHPARRFIAEPTNDGGIVVTQYGVEYEYLLARGDDPLIGRLGRLAVEAAGDRTPINGLGTCEYLEQVAAERVWREAPREMPARDKLGFHPDNKEEGQALEAVQSACQDWLIELQEARRKPEGIDYYWAHPKRRERARLYHQLLTSGRSVAEICSGVGEVQDGEWLGALEVADADAAHLIKAIESAQEVESRQTDNARFQEEQYHHRYAWWMALQKFDHLKAAMVSAGGLGLVFFAFFVLRRLTWLELVCTPGYLRMGKETFEAHELKKRSLDGNRLELTLANGQTLGFVVAEPELAREALEKLEAPTDDATQLAKAVKEKLSAVKPT